MISLFSKELCFWQNKKIIYFRKTSLVCPHALHL